MSIRLPLTWFALCLTAVGLLTASPAAHAIIAVLRPNVQFADGSLGYDLVGQASGGLTSPGVLVALNPQPLPPTPNPDALALDLTDPVAPVVTYSGTGNVVLQWWFEGVVLQGVLGDIRVPPPPPPNADGNSTFTIFDGQGNARFSVALHVGPGPVDPASWVALNPQPLPPRVGFQGFGVQFADPTSVQFRLSELSPTGEPLALSFAPVPEPSTYALIGVGLVAVVLIRQRRSV